MSNSKKALAPVTDSTAMMTMISHAAADPQVDVSKMERLWEMKKDFDALEAEKAFNIAMAKAQSEMGIVGADAANPQTHSKYASYAKLDRALRPIYSKRGFSLSFDTGETPVADSVRVLCYVSHKAGHTRTYHADIDASGKGAKGGDVMTKTHASGSAMSYGMRYLLKMIFNVAVGEYDDDGNSAGKEILLITDEQVNYLHAKITDNNLDMDKFKALLKAELGCNSFAEIQMASFDSVNKRIDSAIRAKNRGAQ